MKKHFKPLILVLAMTLFLFILASCTTPSNGVVEINLTYDSNGGSYVGLITYRSDSTIKLPKNPTKPDETFEGWYWDKDIWKNPLSLTSVFSMPIHSELIVYAKWSGSTVIDLNSLKTHAIGEIETEFLKYSAGYAGNYSAIQAEKNKGIQAVNAATSEESIISAKQACITEMAAFPKDSFAISFNTNGGNSIAPITVTYGEKVSKPVNPSKSGYNFDDWYTDAALTVRFNFANPVTTNAILYAGWTKAIKEDAIIVSCNGKGISSEYLEEMGLEEDPRDEESENYYYAIRIISGFLDYLLINREDILRQLGDDNRFEATINGKTYAFEDLISIEEFFEEGYYDVLCKLYDKDDNVIVSHTLIFFAGYPAIYSDSNQVVMYVSHAGKASLEVYVIRTMEEALGIPKYINGNTVVSAYFIFAGNIFSNKLTMYIPDSISNLSGLPIICMGVDTVVIPKTIKDITYLHFSHMLSFFAGFQNVLVDPENPYYSSYDGVLYDKDLARLILAPRDRIKVIVSENATYIDAYSCENVEWLIIPNTSHIVDVHPDAFKNATPKVYVPESMVELYRSHSVWSSYEIRVIGQDIYSIHFVTGIENLEIQPDYIFPGQTLKISDIVAGDGAIFCGWYRNPECTILYDFNPVCENTILYAKFVDIQQEDMEVYMYPNYYNDAYIYIYTTILQLMQAETGTEWVYENFRLLVNGKFYTESEARQKGIFNNEGIEGIYHIALYAKGEWNELKSILFYRGYVQYSEYNYISYNGKAALCDYGISEQDWTTPLSIDGYPVTQIISLHSWGEVKNITISENVKFVAYDIFKNFDYLESLIILSENVLSPFALPNENITIYVAENNLQAYLSDPYWSQFNICSVAEMQ